MGETRNTAYEMVGLKATDTAGGDTSYLPLSLLPQGSTSEETPSSNVGAAEAEEDTRQGGAKMLPEPNGKKNGKPHSKKAVGEA